MTPRAVAAVVAGGVALLVCAACQPLPPAPGAVAAPPAAAAPAPAPAAAPRPSRTPRAAIVPPDSTTPSAGALEVLATIPEPLPPAERIEAPGGEVTSPPLPPPATANPPAAAADTAGAAASADAASPDTAAPADTAAAGEDAGVPVPEPTVPLGQRRPQAADSAVAGPGPASPPPASPPVFPPPPAAARDTCWRVQILAPTEKRVAESARSTAASLLLVPMVVETERGRYKVRTRDCMTRDAAELLRRRAADSGYRQAFRVATAR